jgi:hypothetical protein
MPLNRPTRSIGPLGTTGQLPPKSKPVSTLEPGRIMGVLADAEDRRVPRDATPLRGEHVQPQVVRVPARCCRDAVGGRCK